MGPLMACCGKKQLFTVVALTATILVLLQVQPIIRSEKLASTPAAATAASTRSADVVTGSRSPPDNLTSSTTVGQPVSNTAKVPDVALVVTGVEPGARPTDTGQAPAKRKSSNSGLLAAGPRQKVVEAAGHIPKVIHQFWDGDGVPAFFKDKILSWVDQHPAWEYWFWSASDVRLLLTRCFPPQYLQLYKNYPYTVNRADAMRYFVLYTFGGLYLDLDMVALRPNDGLLGSAPCVLTEETYEHSVLLYNHLRRPNLINAYMACRPRHPLFKMAVDDLPRSKHIADNLRRTGPFFIDNIFRVYNSSQNPSQNGTWNGYRADDVKVLPPKYVMPTYDKPLQEGTLRRKCMPSMLRTHPGFYQQICKEFERRRVENQPYPDSYADHLWIHTYLQERKWKTSKSIPIKDIVPKVVNVTDRILKVCSS